MGRLATRIGVIDPGNLVRESGFVGLRDGQTRLRLRAGWQRSGTAATTPGKHAARKVEVASTALRLPSVCRTCGNGFPVHMRRSRLANQEYLCSIAATNGQVGGFLHTEVAPILQHNYRVVLYLGDFDLQGHQIEANKARRRIDWNRIAITEEQIAQRGLTPIVKKDHRFTTEASGAREFVA